jgi:hypothetical protein
MNAHVSPAAAENDFMSTIHRIDKNIIQKGSYQRATNTVRTKKLSKNFDNEVYLPIMLSFRDGVYYVVDGGHRVDIAKRINSITHMNAFVRTGLTEAQEALWFAKLNNMSNTRAVSALDRFNADIKGGNKNAGALNALLSKYKIKVVPRMSKAKTDYPTIYCVDALRAMYEKDQKATETTLRVLSLISTSLVRSEVVLAIYYIVCRTGEELLLPKWISRLKNLQKTDDIFATIASHIHRSKVTNGGARARGSAEALLFVLNKGLVHKLHVPGLSDADEYAA